MAVALALVSGVWAFAQNDITLNLVLDRYGNETTWEIIDLSDMSIVGSGGPYAQENSNGEYPQPPMSFTGLADGDYRFVLEDSYGDGICCAYGNGSYELVEDATMNIIGSGGTFGDEEIVDFTLPLPPPPVGVPTELSINIELWSEGPNGNGFSRAADIQNAGDDRLFVVEQGGLIWICDEFGQVAAEPFLDISDRVNDSGNEQGLLGLVFHPDYSNNGYFFVNYTSPNGGMAGGTTYVSRFMVSANPDSADAASEEIIIEIEQHSNNHNAGQLAFGPDGYLYISSGDGGGAGDIGNYAQNGLDLLGGMLRLDVDNGLPYTIPADNPWVGDTTVLDEFWAIGLRNAWRFCFDADSGDMWIADVGQTDYEEVNFQPVTSPGGENYGWRCYEANDDFNLSGCGSPGDYVYPVADHNHNTGWCSITGGYVYRGDTYPLLQGHYLYVDYCVGQFYTLKEEDGTFVKRQVLDEATFGFTTFGLDQHEEMYVAHAGEGNIYKIEEPCSASIPTISYDGWALSSSQAVEYFWYMDGVIIDGATDQNYIPEQTGVYYVVADDGNGCLVASEPIDITSTGLEEELVQGLRILPNPANDVVTIAADQVTGAMTLVLTDLAGRTVLEEEAGQMNGGFRKDLNVSALQSGVYLLNIVVDGKAHVEKLMVE